MGSQQCRGLALAGVLFLSGLLLCVAQNSTIKYYDFVLKETNFTKLCSTKSMLTVNGSFPGPEIHVKKGDTVYVTVHNQGDYNITIHWHGVKQPRNPWSDGPEYITQCPIGAGKNFTYQINFTDEVGTLWWHAHSDWSRATVHGVIVIEPDASFPKHDSATTIILASWFKGDVMQVITEALATGGEPNTSDALTINGQPGDLYPCSNESTFRLVVEHGKTYLLRLVNAAMNEELFVNVANHTLTVVATDGAYIKPIKTALIMITPGQTMDVLLTANQAQGHYYYMAARAYASGSAAFDNTTAVAIVQYDKSNGSSSSTGGAYFEDLPAYNDTAAAKNFTSQFRNLYAANLTEEVNQRMLITVSVNQLPCEENATCAGANGTRLSSSLNNISFVTPSMDILQAYYGHIQKVYNTTFPNEPPNYFNFTADEEDSNNLLPALGTRVKVLEYNETVEVCFQGTNLGPENHPMHLHGFSFYLMATGTGNYDNETSRQAFNYVDPPEVNTVGVPYLGWACIRFVADNPGVWFMHCHLERHASWGMNTVFIVKDGKTKETSMLPPPPNMPTC